MKHTKKQPKNILANMQEREDIMTQLRSYQQQTIDDLRSAFKDGFKRVVVQSPTGSGKTVIAASIINMARERGKKVLFCVPMLSLIDQTVDRFRQNGIFDIGVIQGIHEMTDLSQPVQICSIQTLNRRNIPQADLVIVDEVHVMFKLYQTWFNEDRWKGVPFIGLTATPWSKGMGADGLWNKLIVATTTSKLIDEGTLSDFKVFAPAHPDLSGVQVRRGDYDETQLAAVMDQKNLVADVVSTWMERAKGLPTICFAVNRIHAKHLQEQFVASGVFADYMDAYTDLSDRAEIVKRFAEGKTQVICNVGVLTTGFDADVRCIILARPTKSEILYVQMIGRGLRTAPGKDHCLILDHSDTTLRLGFVTDIHHNELNDGTARRTVAERQAPQPKECPQCHFLRAPKVRQCPSCGYVPEARSNIEVDDGELHELSRDGKVKKQKYTMAEKQRWYSQLMLYAETRGYKNGWVYWTYKDKFGVAPDHSILNVPAALMTPEVQSWITARNIRRAKAKEKLGKVA
jgi:superfamily II DNA or RNA helicase